MDELFEQISGDRLTNSGRACVAIAKQVYSTGFREDGQSEASSIEARAWIRLALEADKDEIARRLKRLGKKTEEKDDLRETANRMKARKRAAGSNVVSFPAKDSI